MHAREKTLSSGNDTFYQIAVIGVVHESWSDWFGGMKIATIQNIDDSTITILQGTIPDQAALRAILNRLWDLNATLISVQQTTQSDK